MESLAQTSIRALRGLMAAQPTTPAKIAFAWQMAAGSALARAARVECGPNGTLRVHPRSAAWGKEIHIARHTIVERLGQLLGPGVVKSLVVDDA